MRTPTPIQKKNKSEKLLNWRYCLVEKHIESGEKVLDIGAGTGWVADRLAARKECDVRLVDLIDCNETSLPLTVYDGKKLPFPDKEFDVTMLVFVLHHALNQDEILREAARVTRRRIIIVEDTPKNLFEHLVEKFWDTVLSIEHKFFAPHNYLKIQGWQEKFKQLGLKLSSQEVVNPFFPFYYTKAVFVIDLERPAPAHITRDPEAP